MGIRTSTSSLRPLSITSPTPPRTPSPLYANNPFKTRSTSALQYQANSIPSTRIHNNPRALAHSLKQPWLLAHTELPPLPAHALCLTNTVTAWQRTLLQSPLVQPERFSRRKRRPQSGSVSIYRARYLLITRLKTRLPATPRQARLPEPAPLY